MPIACFLNRIKHPVALNLRKMVVMLLYQARVVPPQFRKLGCQLMEGQKSSLLAAARRRISERGVYPFVLKAQIRSLPLILFFLPYCFCSCFCVFLPPPSQNHIKKRRFRNQEDYLKL